MSRVEPVEIHIDLKSFSKFLSTRNRKGTKEIFNPIRKNWLILQPEELVRQLFIQFLMQEKRVPKSLISTEVSIVVNDQIRRYDIAVTNPLGKTILLVECKSFDVSLGYDTYRQIGQYNQYLQSKYVVVTNGLQTHFLEIDHKLKAFQFLQTFPSLAI